jgi:opacity protein-like surface antigen
MNMRKATPISALLLALALLVAAGAQANAPRVTQGDAQAVFEAFGNGGWGVVLNGGNVEEGAPSDFLQDSMARISPAAQWNGRHFCSLDWHVISVAANEGNPLGGSRTNEELRETLSQIVFLITLDGALLDIDTTAIKRTTNPERIGAVEAFYITAGRVMAPEDLAVGQHSVQFTGIRPGRPPMVMPAITFFIDAPGTGTCL